MKKIIALTSYKRCGKDTFYKALKIILRNQKKSVTRIAFADNLKNIISKITNFNLNEIENLKDNTSTKFLIGKKMYNMRELLIDIAENCREIAGSDFWAKIAIQEINNINSDYIIITDLRFLREYELLKKLNIDSSDIELYIVRIASNLPGCKLNDNEKEVDLIPVDYTVQNLKLVSFNENDIYTNLMNSAEELIKNIENIENKTKGELHE